MDDTSVDIGGNRFQQDFAPGQGINQHIAFAPGQSDPARINFFADQNGGASFAGKPTLISLDAVTVPPLSTLTKKAILLPWADENISTVLAENDPAAFSGL